MRLPSPPGGVGLFPPRASRPTTPRAEGGGDSGAGAPQADARTAGGGLWQEATPSMSAFPEVDADALGHGSGVWKRLQTVPQAVSRRVSPVLGNLPCRPGSHVLLSWLKPSAGSPGTQPEKASQRRACGPTSKLTLKERHLYTLL